MTALRRVLIWSIMALVVGALLVAAGLTMLVGIFGAIAQSEIKRIVSFTLVSHIGYMLFGVALGTSIGLSAAIYNEVLQFFVIVAALAPLTIIGLNRVGGWNGLKDAVAQDSHFHTWPGTDISGFENPVWSVIGIVLA